MLPQLHANWHTRFDTKRDTRMDPTGFRIIFLVVGKLRMFADGNV